MKTMTDSIFVEKIRNNMKELITNIIIDNFYSYSADLSGIKVEFDSQDPTLVHIKLPTIISNKIKR